MTRGQAAWLLAALLLGACGGVRGPDAAAEDEAADTTVTTDASSRACLLTAEEVGAAVGGRVRAEGPVAGGAGGDSPDGQHGLRWQGCSYEVSDGSRLTVAELLGADGEADVTAFDLLWEGAVEPESRGRPPAPGDDAESRSTGGRDRRDRPVVVEGLGDGAVAYGGRLYVRVGERAAMVEGETASGRRLASDLLAAVGDAVVGALR